MAANIEAIIDTQFDEADIVRGFRVADPHTQKSSQGVRLWSQSPERAEEVCAIRFLNSNSSSYELHGFDSVSAAEPAGFTVTHQGRCGSCSTLEDLAIYLAISDLTSPARKCARRTGLKRKKLCFQDVIGFTPYCAESWAYNILHTRQECMGTCIGF